MMLKLDFKVIEREPKNFVYLETFGPFEVSGPLLWREVDQVLFPKLELKKGDEILGLSKINMNEISDKRFLYQAGFTISEGSYFLASGHKRTISGGSYAKFLLQGSYSNIGAAFKACLAALSKKQIVCRNDFFIEKYLNDPHKLPEHELLTELLIPTDC